MFSVWSKLQALVCFLARLDFAGMVKGLTVVVPQTAIEGYEDQPLLLQASCRHCQTETFLQITWNMVNISKMIVMYTIRNNSSLNEKLFMAEEYQERATVYVNGSLLIHKLRLNDQGMYEVSMKNSKTSKSGTIKVSVLRPVKGLRIVLPQTSIEGYEDQPLLLQTSCHLCQIDPFLQITWTRKNSTAMIMFTLRKTNSLTRKLVTSDHYRDRATVFENGSLLIHELHQSDQGTYEVNIQDDRYSETAVINVTVLRNHEGFGMEHCSCPGNGSTDGYPATPMVYLAMRGISVVVSALIVLGVHLLLKRLTNNKTLALSAPLSTNPR